jgi:hypothetical protein
MPQPFVRCDEAFLLATIQIVVRAGWPPDHSFQDKEQLGRNLQISLVAGMVEGEPNFIAQTPEVGVLNGEGPGVGIFSGHRATVLRSAIATQSRPIVSSIRFEINARPSGLATKSGLPGSVSTRASEYDPQ